jgi:hypothetical protein
MDRVYWEERVKAIPDDMNALHENTEGAFAEFVAAMAGNTDVVLFKDAPPAVSHPASTILTNIPEQWFAVDGIFCKIPVSVDSRADTPDYISIYFVAYRTDVTGTRDRYTLAGGVVSVSPTTVIIRKPSNCRIEIVTSGNPLTPPGPPVLGPNDINYVKYCDIVWTGTGTPTVTHNVGALWSFPGAGITYTPHATTHLPVGTDPIQLAALGGDPLGSRPGLMPSGSFSTLMGSLQDVLIDPAALFLTRSLSGDNSPGNPKQVTLNVKLDESMTIRDVSSVKRLAVNFRSGGYSGSDERAARYDHRHSPGESPIAVEFFRIDVDSGNLGAELAIAAFASIARIQMTQVFWLPPLSNDDPYPLFDCAWLLAPGGTIGARAHIIKANEVVIETGGSAYTALSIQSNARATAAVGGTVTWTFSGYSSNPTSGSLLVKVTGER